jgi:hypothetical protein
VLRGTSAEIRRWDTYKRTVRVRAERLDTPGSDPAANGPELHLRLLIEADTAESDSNTRTHSSGQRLLELGSNTEMSDNSLKPSAANGVAWSQNSHDGSQTSIRPQQYVGVEIDRKYY